MHMACYRHKPLSVVREDYK